MEFWEFVLQKEGLRSWLPLHAPSVEISEGKYRVLARTSHADTNVEICVTHQATVEVPPKRRTQKLKRRTNSDGLIAIIPFTHLKPGVWELHCSADVTSDLFSHLLSDSYKHCIQIRVSPAVNSEGVSSLVNSPTAPAPARHEEAVSLNQAIADVVETPENFKSLQPSPPPPLAPQISKPTSTPKAPKSPQLPKFSQPQQVMPVEAENNLPPDTVPEANSQSSKDAAEVPLDSQPKVQPAKPIASPPAASDDGFQALQLKERFWSRLHDLVAADLSEKPAPQPISEPGGSGEEVILEEQPVPIPELLMPAGELIAGESVTVGLKLSGDRARMYVKLWVQDPQTRELLDGPRYLMDFFPDGSGNQSARTQLIVPLGCQEIWVEAVAIDMSTQRESYKARLERMVVPPNLPSWYYKSEA